MGDDGAAVGDGEAAAGSVRARLEARLVMLTKHRLLQPRVAERDDALAPPRVGGQSSGRFGNKQLTSSAR